MNALEAIVFAQDRMACGSADEASQASRYASLGLPDFSQALMAHILDELDIGVVVTDPAGHVRFANRSAVRVCDRGAPCRIVQGVVKPAHEHEELAFARALRQAADGRRSLMTMEDGGKTRFLAFVPVRDEPHGESGVLLLLGRAQVCGALSV